MDKLVMLLDIYEEEVVGVHSVWEHITEKDKAWIISKQFWFIDRLIENDKIDIESYCRITSVERKWEKDVYRDEVDSLLMLLSISDTPIEDLVYYLK